MVSTITLRFGSSVRTRKMLAPPMPSRCLSTVSPCSSINAWIRSGSRVTSVGATNCGNSVIASFSLWSRSAAGRLKTRAPLRSAASRSQVLATYSRSKGGSLRITVASNEARVRLPGGAARYQSLSSASSVSCVVVAETTPPESARLPCSQTCTA